MASTLQPLKQLPAPQVPIVDPRTGVLASYWFEYIKSLDAHVREIETRLTAGGL